MASLSLRDNKGPVEAHLRKTLNAVGVDPYDVNFAKLHKNAALHKKTPISRLTIKGQGVSPCAQVSGVDYAVHVTAPEMLRERHLTGAVALRKHSPRWGHRVPGDKAMFVGAGTPNDKPYYYRHSNGKYEKVRKGNRALNKHPSVHAH